MCHSTDPDIAMCRDIKRRYCGPANSKQHSIHAIGTHSKEGCELDVGSSKKMKGLLVVLRQEG